MRTTKLALLLLLGLGAVKSQNCTQDGVWPETVSNDEAVLLCNPISDIGNINVFQKVVASVIPRPTKKLLTNMFEGTILQTRECGTNGVWGDVNKACPTAAGCWAKEHVYTRDLTCDAGYELDGGLCYKNCKEGYDGVGPVCWEQCATDFEDKITFCKSKGPVVKTADNSKCPWYDKCGLTFKKHCTVCPEGYNNLGCLCNKEEMYTKNTYGRGVGNIQIILFTKIPSFSPCSKGGKAVGPLCVSLECPAGYADCGILCTNTEDKCRTMVATIVGDATAVALAGGSIISWIALLGAMASPDQIRLLLETVLSPMC